MSELDKEWARKVAEAERRARVAGRGDVADYLTLRATNDEARRAGIEWLFALFTAAAGEANRAGARITEQRADAHRFRMGASTMVGTLLTLRADVRALMVEAGWPRSPRDGIVRGGGLASARVRHFGDLRAGEDLLLFPSTRQAAAPEWHVIEESGGREAFLETHARRHLARLLDVK